MRAAEAATIPAPAPFELADAAVTTTPIAVWAVHEVTGRTDHLYFGSDADLTRHLPHLSPQATWDLDRATGQWIRRTELDAIEQAISELHEDLSKEAGGSPWHPIALELIEQARADIAGIIERARRSSTDYAPLGGAAQFADRIADVWWAAHPGLARFYKLTDPAAGRAGDERARAEAEAARKERIAARHAEFRAYLCSMADHGCECIALDFQAWALVAR